MKKFERYGISAVALMSENHKKDTEMWKKFDHGDYQIIFASPEILAESKGHFRDITMKKSNSEFKKRLVLIAIDEAHIA